MKTGKLTHVKILEVILQNEKFIECKITLISVKNLKFSQSQALENQNWKFINSAAF